MGISSFLQKLLDEGIRLGYFQMLPIGQIDKTCCSAAQTEAIDFDETEEKLRIVKGFDSIL